MFGKAMVNISLQKKLFKAIRGLQKDIEELSKYCTPHLVGEISRQNGEWNIDLTISLIEEPLKEPLLVKENNTIMFICPIKDIRPLKGHQIYSDPSNDKPRKSRDNRSKRV